MPSKDPGEELGPDDEEVGDDRVACINTTSDDKHRTNQLVFYDTSNEQAWIQIPERWYLREP